MYDEFEDGLVTSEINIFDEATVTMTMNANTLRKLEETEFYNQTLEFINKNTSCFNYRSSVHSAKVYKKDLMDLVRNILAFESNNDRAIRHIRIGMIINSIALIILSIAVILN